MQNELVFSLISSKIDQLPTLPGVAIKLLKAVQNPEPNLNEISRILSTDAWPHLQGVEARQFLFLRSAVAHHHRRSCDQAAGPQHGQEPCIELQPDGRLRGQGLRPSYFQAVLEGLAHRSDLGKAPCRKDPTGSGRGCLLFRPSPEHRLLDARMLLFPINTPLPSRTRKRTAAIISVQKTRPSVSTTWRSGSISQNPGGYRRASTLRSAFITDQKMPPIIKPMLKSDPTC